MMTTKRGIGTGVALMAVVIALAAFMLVRTAFAASPTGDSFVIDATSGGVVNATATYGVGASFKIDVNISAAPDAYSAYQANVWFNPSVLKWDGVAPTETSVGGASLCGGGTEGAFSLYDGCARTSGTSTLTGVAFTWGLVCIAPGVSPLHLATDTEAGGVATGTNFAIASGVGEPTGDVDASVTCTLPVTKSDDHGGSSVGPTTGTIATPGVLKYTVQVGNPGTSSLPGHVVTDTVPAAFVPNPLSIVSTNGPIDGCSFTGNTLKCATAVINAGGWSVSYTVNVPDPAAGLGPLCNAAQLDAGPAVQDCDNVSPAAISVTKAAVPPAGGQYQTGQTITWNITVKNNGPSEATGVVVTDTNQVGFTLLTAPTVAPCTSGPLGTWTCGTMAAGQTVNLTVTGTVVDPAAGVTTCSNKISATSTNSTATPSQTATVACASANVKMEKHTVGEIPSTNGGTIPQVNLWLCKAATCTANGQGSLSVGEFVSNVAGDQWGVGAFEFDVLYDNSVFNVSIAPTGWLYATNRVPGAPGIGGCAATIITENDIRFGCVSKNPVDTSGNPIITQGNTADGQIATITVTPKADLVNRLTPGNDNGVIRTLIDQGCELADIWGHPLAQTSGTFPNLTTNVDALGRPILLPGIAPGGQVIDCGSLTITVRILEGDMNLDCAVTVADDQIEASHYGAFFGSLLYQPWYDLEPALKDGDVDIKDLQKVFGRNGSTCAAPVPAQPPLPMPVDP